MRSSLPRTHCSRAAWLQVFTPDRLRRKINIPFDTLIPLTLCHNFSVPDSFRHSRAPLLTNNQQFLRTFLDIHPAREDAIDRKSTRLNYSQLGIWYAVFC